jgi:hypothetical protein
MDPASKAYHLSTNSEKRERQLANLKKFKPGQSGNPQGRPKKKPITEMFEELLADGEVREEIKARIRRTMTERGMAGVLLLKEAAERTEGKISQELEINGNITSLTDEELAEKAAAVLGGSQ